MEPHEYAAAVAQFDALASHIITMMSAFDRVAEAGSGIAEKAAQFGGFDLPPGRAEAELAASMHVHEIEAIRARVVAALYRPWDSL